MKKQIDSNINKSLNQFLEVNLEEVWRQDFDVKAGETDFEKITAEITAQVVIK